MPLVPVLLHPTRQEEVAVAAFLPDDAAVGALVDSAFAFGVAHASACVLAASCERASSAEAADKLGKEVEVGRTSAVE